MILIKKNFILFFALLFLFLFSIIHAAEEEQKKSNVVWDVAFDEAIDDFEYENIKVTNLVKELNIEMIKFRSNLKEYTTKFHQLKYVMNNIENNPFINRFIISALNTLHDSYSSSFVKIKKMIDYSNSYTSKLKKMEDDLEYILNNKLGFYKTYSLIRACQIIFNIRMLIAELKLETDKMKYFFDQAKIQMEELNTIDDYLYHSLDEQLKSFFLKKEEPVKIATYYSFIYLTESWIKSLPVFLMVKLPNTAREYQILGIIFVIFLFIYHLSRLIIFRKFSIKEKFSVHYKNMLNTYISFLIYIGLLIVSFIYYFPHDIVAYQFSIIFFGIFGYCLVCCIQKIRANGKRKDELLGMLLVLFIFAILFQVFSMNYNSLIFAWSTAMLTSALYLIVRNRITLENVSIARYLIFLFLVACLFVLSVGGLVSLSILLCMIWYLSSILYRIGFALIMGYNKIIDHYHVNRYLYSAFLTGICIPVVWLMVIIFLFLWASMQISADPLILFGKIFNAHIVIDGYDLKAMKVFFAVFIFFMFKCFSFGFNDYLQHVPLTRGEKSSTRHNILPSIQTLVSYLIWFLYLIIFFTIFKISISSLLVILGGISVGIGLGLQDMVNNFISGLIIMFGGICKPGDVVELEGMWGTVKKTDSRNTTIHTFDNCTVTFPNSALIDKSFKNWTKNNDLVRKDISIRVMYGSDVEKTTRLLLEIAGSAEGILKKPAPQVYFEDFANSSLLFKLRFWLDNIDNMVSIPSEIRYKINKLFEENGIIIAYPRLNLEVNKLPENVIETEL